MILKQKFNKILIQYILNTVKIEKIKNKIQNLLEDYDKYMQDT